MALSFPDTTGQPTDGSFTYTVDSNTWVWDGQRWSLREDLEDSSDNIDTTGLTDGASLIYNAETEKWEAKTDTSAIAFAIALS